MFFTRMPGAPQNKAGKRIYTNQPVPDQKSICNICKRRNKKLLNPLGKRQRIGKRKKERPHRRPPTLQLTEEPQRRRQLAWVDTKWGTQPVTVKTHIRKKEIKALVDSGADEDYIHWKTARELGLQLRKKRKPYMLYGIGGNETSYNKGMVMQETGLIQVQFNGQR